MQSMVTGQAPISLERAADYLWRRTNELTLTTTDCGRAAGGSSSKINSGRCRIHTWYMIILVAPYLTIVPSEVPQGFTIFGTQIYMQYVATETQVGQITIYCCCRY